MKVYIAGPMRGYEKFNFPAFDAATETLRAKGFIPVSPADMDRLYEGWTDHPPEGITFEAHDFRRFITRDLDAISHCDAVYMLKGWEDSKGANVEKALAEFLGLHIMYEGTK